MLDEAEFGLVASKCVGGVPGEQVLAEFERITGYKERNPAAIWHHRMALYGPPCRSCEKPLRTPRATLCGSCMTPVGSTERDSDKGSRLWVHEGQFSEVDDATNVQAQKLDGLPSPRERGQEASRQAQMKAVQVPVPVPPSVGIKENKDNEELKQIGLGFLLILLICIFLYWIGHSRGNSNCEMEGDGTINCE